ncbi:MAG TPA: phosphoribosyl-AMP cyclohydrolase [Vicinamibacterales bacterium]|jgi:phosphoribosyl-AMP cyclohydrolase|nr:phosphoribosyl-AMP cyclohydrolase [Vicinamibacterales bacterium]
MLDFDKMAGLLPAVVQDDESGEVLMVGFMNETALARTRETGFVTFFSRTRNALWTKGETSGNRLAVKRLLVDCDEDTLLVRVERQGDGNVCHTGARSCFFRELQASSTSRSETAPRASEASRGVAGVGGGAPTQEKKR